MSSETYPDIKVYESEKFFRDTAAGKQLEFPSIKDAPTKSLSVIIPAYNEENRCKYRSLLKTS